MHKEWRGSEVMRKKQIQNSKCSDPSVPGVHQQKSLPHSLQFIPVEKRVIFLSRLTK